jgi:serine/threonine protein kinase
MTDRAFISAKSEDYAHARVVYDFLKARHIACFFADRSLMDRGVAAYRRVIDDALESAVHMVVVTSSREHARSNWVEYEWGFFHNEILAGRKQGNLLTVLCDGLATAVLPPSLRGYQTLRLESDLERLPYFLPGVVAKGQAETVVDRPPLNLEGAETVQAQGADPVLRSLAAEQLIARRFRLKEVLGRGGMGVVWRAYDEDLRKFRALKFLREEFAGDPAAVAELKDEVGRCQELSHRHIVRVFELVKDEARGSVAVSMEIASGGSITARRVQKPHRWFEPEELLPWIEQLCAALTYIHEEAGLVHRDLKPGNLLLDDRDLLKVSDFGISSRLTESLSRRTGEVPTSGTAAYMSPEQAAGKPPHASDDLYALGATLYDLLTGQPPFKGPRSTVLAQLHSEAKAPSIAERRLALENVVAPIPREWEDVIAELLAKTAAQRPKSAREVVERLRASPTRPPTIAPKTEDRVTTAVAPVTPILPAAPTVPVAAPMVAPLGDALEAVEPVSTSPPLKSSPPIAAAPERSGELASKLALKRESALGVSAPLKHSAGGQPPPPVTPPPIEPRNVNAPDRRRKMLVRAVAIPGVLLLASFAIWAAFMPSPKALAPVTDATPAPDPIATSATPTPATPAPATPAPVAATPEPKRATPVPTPVPATPVPKPEIIHIAPGPPVPSAPVEETAAGAKKSEPAATEKPEPAPDLPSSKGDLSPATTPPPAPEPDPPHASTPAPDPEGTIVNHLGMKFVPIPGIKPLVCTTVTTVEQYKTAAQDKSAGLEFRAPNFPQEPNHPVVNVSFEEAKKFCAWLSKKEGKKYRLPTDSEWTAAATADQYPWGESLPPPKNWGNYAGEELHKLDQADIQRVFGGDWHLIEGYSDPHPYTAPVESSATNAHGLHDMGGNVWQWCDTAYKTTLNSEATLREHPFFRIEKSGGLPNQVLRGGSWREALPLLMMTSCRNVENPKKFDSFSGFRCVLELTHTWRVTGIKPNSKLSVRSGAGHTFQERGSVPPNATGIEITGPKVMNDTDAWVPVRAGRLTGFVNSKYLQEE